MHGIRLQRSCGRHGLAWEHPAPDEAFMVLPLREGHLAGDGLVRYAPEFEQV